MNELEKLPRWLGITKQQFHIIEAIVSLQKEGKQASPKAIIDRDAELHQSRRIQKSNFFAQLKNLRERGFVKKTDEASYEIDFNAIKKALDEARNFLDTEIYELDEIRGGVMEFFGRLSVKRKEPAVMFFDYDDMYYKTAGLLKTAKICYVTGIFPRILYAQSPSLMQIPGARLYVQTLWERCIMKKELEVNYLTHFDIEYLFRRLARAYKNPRYAYDEINMVLNGLADFITNNEKLKLFYSPSPYGLDMIIPHNEDMNEFFLMVRDEKSMGVGAVYINSPELANRFKGLFEAECSRAVRIDKEEADKITGKLRKRVETIYSRYKKREG